VNGHKYGFISEGFGVIFQFELTLDWEKTDILHEHFHMGLDTTDVSDERATSIVRVERFFPPEI
jgi:hypothetical protein